MVDYVGIIIFTILWAFLIFFVALICEKTANAVKRGIQNHKEEKYFQAEYQKVLESKKRHEMFDRLQKELDYD